MTLAQAAQRADPDAELMPQGRFEWERLIRRAVLPQQVKFLALVMASYADPDGSRVRPGADALASVLGVSDRTVRRLQRELTDRFGLLQLVMRGGGRGAKGRTAVYRLTIPTDLLERVEMLPPSERATRLSPDSQMSGDTNDSPDTQVSGDTNDSPDTQVSDQGGQSPVDNPDTPETVVSGQSPETSDIQVADESGLTPDKSQRYETYTGQIESIDRTPCMSDYHPYKTNHLTEDHPSPELPAELTTARENGDHGEITVEVEEIEPAPPPRRCQHGLVRRRNAEGQPACALCRRELSTVDTRHVMPADVTPEETP